VKPRFVGRLSIVDAVTVANAMLGLVAIVAVTGAGGPSIGARVLLLAAIADGLDGVLARRRGPTTLGGHLDSLADAISFGVAPAVLVHRLAAPGWWTSGVVDWTPPLGLAPTTWAIVVTGVAALFVASAVIRLAIYTVADRTTSGTRGAQTTLAATLLGAGILSGLEQPAVVLGVTAVLTGLMVTRVPYPDLSPSDAVGMGTVQAGAIAVPTLFHRALPRLLLVAALGYLVLAPALYPRTTE